MFSYQKGFHLVSCLEKNVNVTYFLYNANAKTYTRISDIDVSIGTIQGPYWMYVSSETVSLSFGPSTIFDLKLDIENIKSQLANLLGIVLLGAATGGGAQIGTTGSAIGTVGPRGDAGPVGPTGLQGIQGPPGLYSINDLICGLTGMGSPLFVDASGFVKLRK